MAFRSFESSGKVYFQLISIKYGLFFIPRMAGRGRGVRGKKGLNEWEEVWVECVMEDENGIRCGKWDYKNVRKGEMNEDLYECNDCRYERVLKMCVNLEWECGKLAKRVAFLEGKEGNGDGKEERENMEGEVQVVEEREKGENVEGGKEMMESGVEKMDKVNKEVEERTDMEVQESGIEESKVTGKAREESKVEEEEKGKKREYVILEGGAGRNRGKGGSDFFFFSGSEDVLSNLYPAPVKVELPFGLGGKVDGKFSGEICLFRSS